MSEKKVVTPIGFLEAVIEVDPSLPSDFFLFTRSYVEVYKPTDPPYSSKTSVIIGSKIAIPLLAGKYKAHAMLGQILSKEIEVEIEAGKIEKVTFYFGKET